MPSDVKHPDDFREFEHKYLLSVDHEHRNPLLTILGGDPANFHNLDVGAIDNALHRLDSSPNIATKVDQYFVPDIEDLNDFFQVCHFEKTADKQAVLHIGSEAISFRRYAQQDMEEAYQGLVGLITEAATLWKMYNQLQRAQTQRDDAHNVHAIVETLRRLKEIKLRVRTEKENGTSKYILTAKDKANHEGGIEENPEYELRFCTEKDVQAYRLRMHLAFNAQKTKHTRTHRYDGMNLERVTVQEIPGAEFLELEKQAPVDQRDRVRDAIHARAASLHIPKPAHSLSAGGYGVDTGYLTIADKRRRSI